VGGFTEERKREKQGESKFAKVNVASTIVGSSVEVKPVMGFMEQDK